MNNEKKLVQLMQRIRSNPKLAKEFENDPASFLEKHNINTDDLPPEIMEKISGGLRIIDGIPIVGSPITGGPNGRPAPLRRQNKDI